MNKRDNNIDVKLNFFNIDREIRSSLASFCAKIEKKALLKKEEKKFNTRVQNLKKECLCFIESLENDYNLN